MDEKVTYQTHGCITTAEWKRALKDILNTPNQLVLHTVLLPPGFDPSNSALSTAEIIEEKRYKLKPGHIPDSLKTPAAMFDARIDTKLVPLNRPMPSFVSVVAPHAVPPTDVMFQDIL